ncbi:MULTISPECIES: potassium channel family protein [Streptomyces]|uniref:Potassium channel family protein n=1 Tax=Streptomyces solicathayae TaxID=3081768 RepID=A0ABZ0M344_9ACTN|nr:potassium channel family protein [Streptomyces sp. HUAS YS2]WOX25468.1 potassium channel family protein [Streptomyces sp. HUAS YS2]
MNDRSQRQEQWEDRTDALLAVASLAFLAGYAVRILGHDLPQVWQDVCLAITFAAWAVFVVDYVVRMWLSGLRPLRFVRSHVLDTIVVLLPLLRPLRMVTSYDKIQRRRDKARLTLYVRVMAYAGLSSLLLGFASALTVYSYEYGAPGATIRTFGDSVWWACSTLSTVGYGDVSPVTPGGRVTAVGLMACGLALLGAVTGSFSSWLIQTFTREDEKRPPGDFPGAS